MTFSRLLPLLLLVPALTMADDDRNFKIMSENFKVGSVLEHASNIAIVLDSSVAISSQPVSLYSRTNFTCVKKNR